MRVEVRDLGKALRLVLAAVDEQDLMAGGEKLFEDGAPDEPRPTQQDDTHLQPDLDADSSSSTA